MEMNKWFTGKELLERWRTNAVTLSILIVEKNLPFYSISTFTPIENRKAFIELKKRLQPDLFPKLQFPEMPCADLHGLKE